MSYPDNKVGTILSLPKSPKMFEKPILRDLVSDCSLFVEDMATGPGLTWTLPEQNRNNKIRARESSDLVMVLFENLTCWLNDAEKQNPEIITLQHSSDILGAGILWRQGFTSILKNFKNGGTHIL
jgi:hypothetical protein